MHVYIKTYGCTLNQADTDVVESVLSDSGITASQSEDSDVVIVNTCTVKGATERRISQYLDMLSRDGKKIIVTGCMAGSNRDIILKHAPDASIVTIPNSYRMAEAVRKVGEGDRVAFTDYKKVDRLEYVNANSFGGTIAKIQVSDGCLSSCGFCETRFARGPLNSFSEDLIINAVKMAVRKGAKEIELTSQDMGAYGMDKGTNIAELMERISGMEGDFRVRVGMLNPEHLNKYIERFAEAMKSDRFYKFVHLPVQSGNDRVLTEMGRNYTVSQVHNQLDFLRSTIPDITFMTDIIVGYPTEKREDLNDTLRFIRDERPDTTNLSRFTQRPNARASKMKQVPDMEIKERSGIAAKVVREVQHSINSNHVGKTYSVLITERNSVSFNGRTDMYKQVVLNRNPDVLIGNRYDVGIYASSSNVLYGSVV